MFLVDADNPGWRDRARSWTSIDRSFPGGHAEVAFEDCLVADDAVLGEVGLGFRYAQVRLGAGPADALHALARARAPVARHRARPRAASARPSGTKLGELGMVQQLIADSVHRPRDEPRC